MGLTRQFALRATLYLLATLVGIAGSLVLVRKLDPEDYAYYQGLIKRAFQVGWLPFAATGLVIYRKLAVRNPSATSAFIFQTLLTLSMLALAAFSWALISDASPILVLASIVVIILHGLWVSLRFLADTWRPVMVSFVVLMTRLLLSSAIIIFVYFFLLGLWGALIATAFSMALGSFYFATVLARRTIISNATLGAKRFFTVMKNGYRTYIEYLKRYYEANILNAVNVAVQGLDVFVATTLRGLSFTAPFLAFQSVMSLLQETLVWSSRVFQRNLITGESSALEAARTMHLIIIASTPLFLFAAYNPTHIAMLLNPAYTENDTLLTIISIASLTTILQAIAVNTLLGTIPVESKQERPKLTSIYKLITSTRIAYLSILIIALQTITENKKTLETWGLLYLGQTLAITIGALLLTSKDIRKTYAITLTKSLTKASTISLALLHLTSPLLPAPQPRFWDALASLLPPATIYLATYTLILILADKEARSTLAKLPTLIKKPR